LTGEAGPLVEGTDAGAAAWTPARKHPVGVRSRPHPRLRPGAAG
jgi:hypothetical protein